MRPRDIYRFGDPFQVEIVARVARTWLDEDTLDPAAGRLAEAVLKVRDRRASRIGPRLEGAAGPAACCAGC
jgi:hypothetical protein